MGNRIAKRKARQEQARMAKQMVNVTTVRSRGHAMPNFWQTPKGMTGKIRPIKPARTLPARPAHIFFSCGVGGIPTLDCPGCAEDIREQEVIAAKKAAFKESIERLEHILNPPKDIRRDNAEWDF